MFYLQGDKIILILLIELILLQSPNPIRNAVSAPDSPRGGRGASDPRVPPQSRATHLPALRRARNRRHQRKLLRRRPFPPPAHPRRPVG